MKYFLMIVISMWSLFALANENLIGEWLWIGNQCRNSTMSNNSVRGVTGDASGFSLNMLQILMDSQNKATFTYIVEGSRTRQEQATYQVASNNTVIMSNESGRLTARVVDGVLLVYDPVNSICHSNERFVRLFSRMTN